MSDVLEGTSKAIERRLSELEPLMREYERLLAAERALAGIPAAPNGRRRRSGRSSAAKQTRRARTQRKRPAGRPRGTGGRATETLALVQSQPGITIPELAAKMGIKQNYLYRVMPRLQKEGKVGKRGRGWHPAG
jgi:hypothetical protein